ncbi:MAG TPA: TIGR02996 domain-containing protein [Gemmataceae bacterium]|nr:TIGR02996 domain-containing protein [Gemmataceae bacterium]
MSTTAPDRPFLEAILANPEDAAPLLIFADWLEERGRSDLAFACRWMGYRGYRPGERRRPRLRKPWAWWHEKSAEYEADLDDRTDVARCPHARLPALLFQAMTGRWLAHAYYLTWPEAANGLAAGLKRLRDLTSLDAPHAP